MGDTAVTAAQAIVVALLVLFGQIAVARISKGAQREAVEVDSQEKATSAWQKYAEKMEARLEAVELREADVRRRVSALEQQVQRDRDLIRRLLGRLQRALTEIRRLGGEPSDADLEVADLARARLDLR